MLDNHNNVIYTIGHSNHSYENFISMLTAFNVELLIDVRSYPGSSRNPHFNKEQLKVTMPTHNIDYVHMPDLGGRRNKADPQSINTGWRLPAFRNYADHMMSASFSQAIKQLENLAQGKKIAYMCSECLWWQCHRSIISDYLKSKGWKIIHIMSKTKGTEHTYTSPARIIDGQLSYPGEAIVNN